MIKSQDNTASLVINRPSLGAGIKKGFISSVNFYVGLASLPGKIAGHVFGRCVGLLGGIPYKVLFACYNTLRDKEHRVQTKSLYECTSIAARNCQMLAGGATMVALSPATLIVLPVGTAIMGVGNTLADLYEGSKLTQIKIDFEPKELENESSPIKKIQTLLNGISKLESDVLPLLDQLDCSDYDEVNNSKDWIRDQNALSAKVGIFLETLIDRGQKLDKFLAEGDQVLKAFNIRKASVDKVMENGRYSSYEDLFEAEPDNKDVKSFIAWEKQTLHFIEQISDCYISSDNEGLNDYLQNLSGHLQEAPGACKETANKFHEALSLCQESLKAFINKNAAAFGTRTFDEVVAKVGWEESAIPKVIAREDLQELLNVFPPKG